MKTLNGITYSSGYKYQLESDYQFQTPIFPISEIETDYIKLEVAGKITIKKSYAWDGATGYPDFKSILRASLIHDAFCQLIELKLLSKDYRKATTYLLYVMCLTDGMNRVLAKVVSSAVDLYFKVKD